MGSADVGAAPAASAAVRPGSPRRLRRKVVIAVLAMVLAGFSALTARLFIWPDLPPLPERADAIVSLGGPGDRGNTGLELVRQGRAPVLAISVPADVAQTHWCHLGRLDGVPVICFQPDPPTTRGEARSIAELARRYGWHSVILVTTPDQAWRASVRTGRCFGGSVSVATVGLAWYLWPTQVIYQMGATVKAYTVETSC